MMLAYNKAKLAIVFVVLCAAVLWLYSQWGSRQEFVHVKAFETISAKLEHISAEKNLSLGEVLNDLEALSIEVKHSHKGLARVGAIYSELNRYEEASALFEQAMEMEPANSDYALQWIYHQAFLHQGKLPSKVRAKATELLANPATKPPAKNMLAMDDYFQGNYQAAIDHWGDILQNDTTLTAERRQGLEKALANAKAKMADSLATNEQ